MKTSSIVVTETPNPDTPYSLLLSSKIYHGYTIIFTVRLLSSVMNNDGKWDDASRGRMNDSSAPTSVVCDIEH